MVPIPVGSVKAPRPGSLALCLLLLSQPFSSLAAVRSTAPLPNGTLQQSIAHIRTHVYPALVNIAVVVRYFSEGRAQRTFAGGSGVIVRPDGYVLTNYHVAGHTTRITCTLPTGDAYEADVITHDPLTDLSVLKLRIDPQHGPRRMDFVKLGDSDRVRVGDYVLALGNPLMLSSSMTLGVVGNTRRVFTNFVGTEIEEQPLEDGERTGMLTRWIQHDALILPGNSGGPLVNLAGEVVGINELGQNGMGFAIPSNIAAGVLEQALKYREVRRGSIGVGVMPVNKLGRRTGTLIAYVAPASPAARAGLRPGDIILSLNGAPTNTRFFEEVPLFQQKIAALQAGQIARMVYARRGRLGKAQVRVERLERYLGPEEELREVGLTVQEITSPMALAQHYPDKNGVLVTGVRTGMPFDTARPPVKEEDVLLSVDDVPVRNISGLRAALKRAEKVPVSVRYRRGVEELITVIQPVPATPPAEGGELPRAWLGVKTQVMTPELSAAVHLPSQHGYRVTQVYPWTEASKAGLRVGDILTALNDQKLNAFRAQDEEDLRRMIEEMSVGDRVKMAVIRDAAPRVVTVTLEASPTTPGQVKQARQKEFEFTVREITRLDRFERRLPKDESGVIVLDATLGGWGTISGLQNDDIILQVNGRAVGDVDAFTSAMSAVLARKPRVVSLFVQRDHGTQFIFIEPDWNKLSLN